MGAVRAALTTGVVYLRSIFAGGGTASFLPSGFLTKSVTTASTPADTNETDLWTYSLPANTLDANAKGVRITVFGSYAANGNNKTIKLYFGATVISDSGAAAANGTNWRFDATVLRTGASAEVANVLRVIGAYAAGTGNSHSTPAADTTGAITIKMTGQNGTANAGDIIFRGATVEIIH